MKAQDLKNSILQLAIQGKLVAQDENDEPAEVLYAKIQAEKQKLIKEGKIKKDKPLPPITEDEIPFPIPPTWKWVQLNDVCLQITDGEHSTPKRTIVKEIPLLTAKNIRDGYITYDNVDYVLEETAVDCWKRCCPENQDILMTCVGYIGRSSIVSDSRKFVLVRSVSLIRASRILDISFLKLVLDSPELQKQMAINTKQTAQPCLYLNKIKSLYFPLPPLEEQKRIVAKIEELEPLINQYDQAEQELSTLNDKFPEQIKKSILQYAIQGKLVAQDENDEPAEVLYTKIQAEKQKLIKEGKIKKDKPLLPITEDEIPFPIPPSWKWVRLGEIGYTQTGTTPSTSNPKYFGKDIPFIKPADIFLTRINYNNEGLSILGSQKSRIIEKNSILMVCIGGSIGKCFKNTQRVCCNQQINTITPYIVSEDYLLYTLQSDYFYKSVWSKATGTATSIVNKNSWECICIPLPPLAEQHRIVAKVNELLKYCEKLKR